MDYGGIPRHRKITYDSSSDDQYHMLEHMPFVGAHEEVNINTRTDPLGLDSNIGSDIDELKNKTIGIQTNSIAFRLVFVVLLGMLTVAIIGSYSYTVIHSHSDLEEDIKDTNNRIDGLNATGFDDLNEAGICTLLETNVDANCLRDVNTIGATEGQLLALNSLDIWVPFDADDICPISCINGTIGPNGIDGLNGTFNDELCIGEVLSNEDVLIYNLSDTCFLARSSSELSVFISNGTDGLDGTNGTNGADGPPGPIVPLCNLTDVNCTLSAFPLGNFTFPRYLDNTQEWVPSTIDLTFIEGDVCPFLESGGDLSAGASIDCLNDVNAPTPDVGISLIGNGTHWTGQNISFTELENSICNNITFVPLDCLGDVVTFNATANETAAPIRSYLIKGSPFWEADTPKYEDFSGNIEAFPLKGIGGAAIFNSNLNQTNVLNPTTLGTVEFTAGEAFIDIGGSIEDLNIVLQIPYTGTDDKTSGFTAFYYNADSVAVNVTIYEYDFTLLNTIGPVVGTAIGSFIASPGPVYNTTSFTVTSTASPAIWIPQTTTAFLYIKALM